MASARTSLRSQLELRRKELRSDLFQWCCTADSRRDSCIHFTRKEYPQEAFTSAWNYHGSGGGGYNDYNAQADLPEELREVSRFSHTTLKPLVAIHFFPSTDMVSWEHTGVPEPAGRRAFASGRPGRKPEAAWGHRSPG